METNQELERDHGNIRSKLDATKKTLNSFKNELVIVFLDGENVNLENYSYIELMSSFNDLKRTHDAATGVIANLSAEVAECRKTANDAIRSCNYCICAVSFLII